LSDHYIVILYWDRYYRKARASSFFDSERPDTDDTDSQFSFSNTSSPSQVIIITLLFAVCLLVILHSVFNFQLSTSHHEMISEQMSDQNSNCVPTIVNGQINPTKNDNNNNSANNNRDYILNLVRESTVKVLENKGKYSKCAKHNILVMDDSHLRGCATKMITSLDT